MTSPDREASRSPAGRRPDRPTGSWSAARRRADGRRLRGRPGAPVGLAGSGRVRGTAGGRGVRLEPGTRRSGARHDPWRRLRLEPRVRRRRRSCERATRPVPVTDLRQPDELARSDHRMVDGARGTGLDSGRGRCRVGADDPAIPFRPIVSEKVTAIGWCAPVDGGERPPLAATATLFRVTDGRRPTSRTPGLSPPHRMRWAS